MRSARWRRVVFWSPLVAATAVTLVLLLRPQPVAVDLAVVERGPLRVTVSDDGATRVKEIFVVSAAVAGLMRRIELHPGDPVVAAQTVIARIEPRDPEFLDVRTEAEARAAVRAAEAAHELAAAGVERASAEREFAESELVRFRGLAERETVSRSVLDDARRRARTAAAALAEAKAALAMREFELERARARLLDPAQAQRQREGCDCVDVYSPVSGRVLRVLQESERSVESGTPLIEVGDPRELEVVVDLLSEDAVQVQPGQRVIVDAWGGEDTLEAEVQRVEPYGFTKISALGIEEQRVNVIIDFTGPSERWARLGHGYRVEPHIVVWQADAVIKVPLAALFRDGERWATFVEQGGRARLRHLELGRQTALEAQVRSGLEPGERVVLHPGERVADTVRLEPRARP